MRLNRGIGGLINYQRRIVAVGDQLLTRNPSYLQTLRGNLDARGDPSTLEVMSVSNVIRILSGVPHA
jgi:hypothetical protein